MPKFVKGQSSWNKGKSVVNRITVGQRFGKLSVTDTSLDFRYRVKCVCDCGREKYCNVYHLLKGNTKSCGCYTDGTKEKMRQAKLRNPTKYWLGKSRSKETNKKIGKANKGKRFSSDTEFKMGMIPWNYKGDAVGYSKLHAWVRRYLGNPDTCEFCGTSGLTGKDIHWANKSGNYMRSLDDWLRLCVSCHREHDKGKDDIRKHFLKKNGHYEKRVSLV